MPKLRLDNKGFTLIEILVVLALTMIVMGLVFSPLVSSLKITRSAEIIIRTQDNARLALSQITADLGNAMYVYDDTENWVNFPMVDANGNTVAVKVYNSKVDMILPRERAYCPNDSLHTPGGIAPGDEAAPTCRVCGALLEMKAIQPLTQDTRIVRYFIGLKDPTMPYSNGYTEQLAQADRFDNTYILYRVEFDPMDATLFPSTDPLTGNPRTADDNRQDEDFFYRQPYSNAWRKKVRPVVTLEGVDLITQAFDSNGYPVVTPLVKFAPTAIYNDPLVPTSSGDSDPERGNAPPATYKASYGYWVMPYKVTLEPEDDLGKVVYETSRGLGPNGSNEPNNNMCIYRIDLASGNRILCFNMTYYEKTKAVSIYGAGDFNIPISARNRVFTVDTTKGTVNFAMPNIQPTLCASLNSRVAGNNGQGRLLSDIASTDFLNDPNVNPESKFLLNCPHTKFGGIDPRIVNNGTVVPGSVKVVAPDALTPAAAPQMVAYTKVPYLINDPGANQFSVDTGYNIDENGNPRLGVAALYFDRSRGIALGQPRLPSGTDNVLIYYQVQNNMKGDVLRANYITKSVMTVTVGIYIYDTGAKRPQSVQFTSRVRLKNIVP